MKLSTGNWEKKILEELFRNSFEKHQIVLWAVCVNINHTFNNTGFFLQSLS